MLPSIQVDPITRKFHSRLSCVDNTLYQPSGYYFVVPKVNLLALSFQRLKETTTDIYNGSGNAMGKAKVDVLASLRLRLCMNILRLPLPGGTGLLKLTAAAISATQVYRFTSTR